MKPALLATQVAEVAGAVATVAPQAMVFWLALPMDRHQLQLAHLLMHVTLLISFGIRALMLPMGGLFRQ